MGDTWGISQNGWFYMFQNSIPMLIQGIGQVVGSLAVVEISPPGLEATIYELLTSASNGAISLSSTLQTSFGQVFKVDEISYDNFHGPMHNEFVSRMARATLFCLAVNVVSAAIFMWFLPKNPQMCKDWLEKKSWHTSWAGLLNIVVFAGPFIYANFSSLTSLLLDETHMFQHRFLPWLVLSSQICFRPVQVCLHFLVVLCLTPGGMGIKIHAV